MEFSAPIIMGFLILGSYSVSNSSFDILVMVVFGVIGYVLRKLDFPLAPVVLTLILGPHDGAVSQAVPGNLPGFVSCLSEESHSRCFPCADGAGSDLAFPEILPARQRSDIRGRTSLEDRWLGVPFSIAGLIVEGSPLCGPGDHATDERRFKRYVEEMLFNWCGYNGSAMVGLMLASPALDCRLSRERENHHPDHPA